MDGDGWLQPHLSVKAFFYSGAWMCRVTHPSSSQFPFASLLGCEQLILGRGPSQLRSRKIFDEGCSLRLFLMLLLLMMRCSVEMFLLHQLPGRVLLKVLFCEAFCLAGN